MTPETKDDVIHHLALLNSAMRDVINRVAIVIDSVTKRSMEGAEAEENHVSITTDELVNLANMLGFIRQFTKDIDAKLKELEEQDGGIE